MNNHLSYCGLVNPRISPSDIDLPVPKGQLISKAIYGVLDSPKKRTKKRFDLIYHSTNESKFFILSFGFLEKLGKQKLLLRLSDL